jgi:hypothetical protein
MKWTHETHHFAMLYVCTSHSMVYFCTRDAANFRLCVNTHVNICAFRVENIVREPCIYTHTCMYTLTAIDTALLQAN